MRLSSLHDYYPVCARVLTYFLHRSDRLQMISTVIGALGVSGIGASVVQTSKVGASKAGVAGLLALPVCGFLQFLTHGSSSIAPTLAQKAELHVKASAGWQRIGRLTHAYRTQIRHMPPGENLWRRMKYFVAIVLVARFQVLVHKLFTVLN